jgi:hypothetical protein
MWSDLSPGGEGFVISIDWRPDNLLSVYDFAARMGRRVAL